MAQSRQVVAAAQQTADQATAGSQTFSPAAATAAASDGVTRTMLAVPRGSFVPPDYQAEAYVDSPIRVGTVSTPTGTRKCPV